MTDLIDQGQIDTIRQALTDVADTFAFPIVLKRTNYSSGAFASDADPEADVPLTAIRDFTGSADYRNPLGPAMLGERDLYIGWLSLETASLINGDNKVLIDNNDVIEMEGEIYKIINFAGVADMTKKPAFLLVRVSRRFQSPNGAGSL